MAQILVRNIDEDTARRLRERARAEGKSVEQTVRDLITEYSRGDREVFWEEADRIRRMTKGGPQLDIVALIREDRDGDHGHDR